MTLQQLEYMMAVYRLRHFAKAADYCHVTQPTLSSMIQKLEDELGVKIFDRKKQPIGVTSVGEAIIEQGWKVLVNAHKVTEVVKEEKHSISGTFRIGILPTIAPYLIPRFFPQLMNEFPDMDVRIVEMKTNEIRQALQRGDIDMGIVADLCDMDEFDKQTLFFEQFFAYVAKNDPLYQKNNVKISDLVGEFLWLLDEGHCFRDQLVKYCQLKAANTSKKAYSLGSIETFMRIVESGKGVTFIPELAVYQLNDSQKKLVKPFAIPVPTREIVMITQKDFIRHRLRQLLVDRIRASIPKELLTLSKMRRAI